MEIGVGLDPSLGLSYADQDEMCRQAAKLGFTSIWTNEGGTGEDAFITCARRWMATAEVVPGGVTTGIAVSPVGPRSPVGFAVSGGTVSKLSGGKFILGIGTSGAYTPEYRKQYGIGDSSMLRLMRDYCVTIKKLVAGEAVEVDSKGFGFHSGKLSIDPPPMTPVYLAALGPEMLRLCGEVADGAALNWCSADFVAWSRERVAEGAARVGRDPSACNISEYIRICVDDDLTLARRAYARAVMGYAVGRGPDAKGRPQGYRAHFERMGFAAPLAEIDKMRAANAPGAEVLDAFPDELLKAVGYYGPADGAAAAFKKLAQGLDTAIVRVVSARPGSVDAVSTTMEACAPAKMA